MRIAGILALAFLVAGCGEAARLDNPLLLRGTDAKAAESVACRVLQELQFQIVYPQAIEGQITTHPLTGASWFEFWREDTVGNDQRIEDSLHTTRRRATVTITPTDAGPEVLVQVMKQRLTAPGSGPESIGETYSIYDTKVSDLERRDELEPTTLEWVDKGRDDQLEQRILARLQNRLQPLAPAGPTPKP